MALTSASFVPERRGVQGPDNYGVGMAKNVDAVTNTDTNSEQHAGFENIPGPAATFGTTVPKSTGAGQGTIRKGGRGSSK